MLVRCLYASRPTKPLSDGILSPILEASRRNNPRRGITGLLCYTSDIFVQVIEGGRDEVCKLITTLVRDDRHRDFCLLVFEEIAERRFSGWTMGHVALSGVNRALLIKYSAKAELDPFSASGASTMALINELVASGAIANRGSDAGRGST